MFGSLKSFSYSKWIFTTVWERHFKKNKNKVMIDVLFKTGFLTYFK